MNPFSYQRTDKVEEALAAIGSFSDASFVAGGTELINWMKEGIANPAHLIDINRLPLASINLSDSNLSIGALARMSDVATDEAVRNNFPAIAESLELSASPQLRNMASMGGNLMQRTRCPYFRAETLLPCNKRRSGSGCSARHGENRQHAIFGWNDNCVATHPSDLAVVLAMLDAIIDLRGKNGERRVPINDLYLSPTDIAKPDTDIRQDELITAIDIPVSNLARYSKYIKIRERASYEFALVSAAAAIEVVENKIQSVSIAVGGVAYKPWRLRHAEDFLAGKELNRENLLKALAEDFKEAKPLEDNSFKVTLAQRAAIRAVEASREMAEKAEKAEKAEQE